MYTWLNVALVALKEYTISYLNSFKTFSLQAACVYPKLLRPTCKSRPDQNDDVLTLYQEKGLQRLLCEIQKHVDHHFYLYDVLNEIFSFEAGKATAPEIAVVLSYSVKGKQYQCMYVFPRDKEMLYPPVQPKGEEGDVSQTTSPDLLPLVYTATLTTTTGYEIDVTQELSQFVGPSEDFHAGVGCPGVSTKWLLVHWGYAPADAQIFVEYDDGTEITYSGSDLITNKDL